MEETEVSPFNQTDLLGQMQAMMEMQRGGGQAARRTINTRHILFIVSGAFDKLPEQVRRRVRAAAIGFGGEAEKEVTETDCLRLAQTRDFVDYGFEPEFIGRIPVRVVCDPLGVPDLRDIMLRSEDNVLRQYVSDFAGHGIRAEFTEEAITAIAERAYEEKTGARGLMTVMERVLRHYKFELPSTAFKTLEIDRAVIEHPERVLKDLLGRKETAQRVILRGELEALAGKFEKEHGLKLTFTREALEALAEVCETEHRAPREEFAGRFKDLEYGLKLIARNTGKNQFRITKGLVQDPAAELSRWVAKSFGKEPA